jgi:glycosyltransferase involved in cell wall biosynthesis
MSTPRPFFTTTEVDSVGRRALLVSAAFPPLHYVGSLRWRSFAKVGAERGWKFDVVMEDPEMNHAVDRDLLNDAPPGLRLFSYRPRESLETKILYGAWKGMRRIRGMFGSPTRGLNAGLDETPGAAGPAGPGSTSGRSMRREVTDFLEYRQLRSDARAALALAREVSNSGRPEIVISSGPPHYSHVAAAQLASESGVPLAIDLRDPWLENEQDTTVHGRSWLRVMRKAERVCVKIADLVVLNTESARALYTARYPDAARKFVTVMNGADPEIGVRSSTRDRFVIAYVGGRYGLRSPANLFAAARRAIDELRVTPEELSIEFMGPEDDHGSTSQALAEQAGIGPYVRSLGKQPRRESLALQARASVLVLLPQAQFWAIPAKVFEHVQFDAWILALTQPESAVASLLAGSGGAVIDPQDVPAIASQLKQWILDYRAGRYPVRLNADGRFDRTRQAAKLFDAIDGVLKQTAASKIPLTAASAHARPGEA